MSIYPIFRKMAFGPDEIAVMTAAYRLVRSELRSGSTERGIVDVAARSIIETMQTGQREPEQIARIVIGKYRP